MKKFISFVFLCVLAMVLAVLVWVGRPVAHWMVKREVAAFIPRHQAKEARSEPVRAETKASTDVKQANRTERKTVNREILESAERLSRTLENCKTTVKTNSVTR